MSQYYILPKMCVANELTKDVAKEIPSLFLDPFHGVPQRFIHTFVFPQL